ncbi:hypothetical protein D3C81_1503470 [compost metagenome]
MSQHQPFRECRGSRLQCIEMRTCQLQCIVSAALFYRRKERPLTTPKDTQIRPSHLLQVQHQLLNQLKPFLLFCIAPGCHRRKRNDRQSGIDTLQLQVTAKHIYKRQAARARGSTHSLAVLIQAILQLFQSGKVVLAHVGQWSPLIQSPS